MAWRARVTVARPACRDHAATEDALAASGVAFTALRNGSYAATVGQFLGQSLGSGQIVLPSDGPVSWTDYTDLAEVAAAILADEGRFDGPTPPLTGLGPIPTTGLLPWRAS